MGYSCTGSDRHVDMRGRTNSEKPEPLAFFQKCYHKCGAIETGLVFYSPEKLKLDGWVAETGGQCNPVFKVAILVVCTVFGCSYPL